MIRQLFSRRSLVGGLLLLILVGEPTIPQANGLYSPPKFIALYAMYFLLYHLFDALAVRYRLVMYQVILLTFTVYSVIITGFFHQEIAQFVVKPSDDIFTILLRIQPAMYIALGLYLLNRWLPRRRPSSLPVAVPLVGMVLLMLLFSLGGEWGPKSTVYTFQTAPGQAWFFALLAVFTAWHAFRTRPVPSARTSRLLVLAIIICAVIGCIPSLLAILVLMIFMSFVGFVVLAVPSLRNAPLGGYQPRRERTSRRGSAAMAAPSEPVTVSRPG